MTTIFASGLLALALGQAPKGIYRPSSATPDSWQINNNHSLIWAGKPYLPVGLHIDGTVAEVERARAAGIRDVIVDLPDSGIGWDAPLKGLNDAKMRFLISINSAAPLASGVAIEPEGYRVTGITEKRTIRASFPGVSSVFVVLATSRDMAVESSARVDTPNGQFEFTVEPGSDIDHVALLYPLGISLQQTDLWEAMDSHRDSLLAALKRNELGPGLRGIVNPLGVTPNLAIRPDRFVSTSPFFRYEFRTFLETRYRNIQTLVRSWSMSSSDLSSFDVAARMVPLWSGKAGIAELWDPDTGNLYAVEPRHSTIWSDIDSLVDTAMARRCSRLVSALRTVADVPVIQDWAGWAVPYESGTVSLNGVGLRTVGSTPSEMLETASRAASSVLRWDRPGWFVGTQIDLGDSASSTLPLANALDDLASIGVRAWFVRSGDPKLVAVVAEQSAKRANDASPADTAPTPVFFPENALNPASAQSLPGGHWWLPTPADGNRIDFGPDFEAYRYRDSYGTAFVIWATGPPRRVKLFMTSTKGVVFHALDGSDPKPKAAKGAIEVLIGNYPLVITGTEEIPIPKSTYDDMSARIAFMLETADREHKDVTEEQYFAHDAVDGFSRNPGGSYTTLRSIYDKLTLKLARYKWIEAESSKNTSFSAIRSVVGVSGGAVLVLETDLRMDSTPYFADYYTDLAAEQDYEVWVAARIPSSRVRDLRLVTGGQTMTADGPDIGKYGAGFGWYKMGVTRGIGKTKIRVLVDAPQGAAMAIDAILLYPGTFTPNGVRLPPALKFEVKPSKR